MKWGFFALFATLVFILVFVSSIDVVTLFRGSHHIINISDSGNDIDCTWCHQWVRNELDNNAEAPHSGMDCEDCHRYKGTGIVFAEHNQAGNQAHAAYTPRCLDCHNKTGTITLASGTWDIKKADAFGNASYGSNVSAHRPLVKQSVDSDLSTGENEACLACHTNYSIKNVFKRPEYFDFCIDLVSMSATLTIYEIAGPNTTTVSKSDSGAKHEFKAINQIKCEDCHSDVWQAANHTELNQNDVPNASHVCWRWEKSGMAGNGMDGNGGMMGGNDPMHNVSYVEASPGYENITEYCTLSCHKPRINPSATIPPVFQETAHAAYRISCYHCHNSTTYNSTFYNQPREDYDTPEFKRKGGHGDIPNEVLGEKLFLHAETCIACKRDGAAGGRYKTWTEPNNTMYMDSTPI